MNRNVNGKQCTILCDVDNLDILHVDSKIVSGVLSDMDTEYGNIVKMTIMRGKIHKYLGMTVD